jgi:hypothetical protein
LAALNLKNKARVLEENLTNFLRDDSNDVFLAKGNDEAKSRKLNSEWEMGNLEKGSRGR